MNYLLYRGPSLLNDEPIKVIAAGVDTPSQNPKTGPMVHTYILVDEESPQDAVKSGKDERICGNCIHRGQGEKSRSCYVNLTRGPKQAWEAPAADPRPGLAAYRFVRIGTYGDPAAVPYAIWEALLEDASGFTGYTHQWRGCDQRLQRICMASVETPAEMREAQSLGWRTYRAVDPAAPLQVLQNETQCPAQTAGAQCVACLACSGTSRRQNHIVARAHGISWIKANFTKNLKRSKRGASPPSNSLRSAPTPLRSTTYAASEGRITQTTPNTL